MVTLTASVGHNKTNAKTDVMNVQLLLNKFIIPGRIALAPLAADGKCGKKTVAAIKMFQAVYFGWNHPDGVVAPNQQTLAALNGDINQPQMGDPSEKTRQAVMDTLKSMSFTSFVMDGLPLSAADFTKVAESVGKRHIDVVYDPTQGDNAEYRHNGNTMLIGFQAASSTFRKSVIVHEAAHAVLDQRAKPQLVLVAEALAFVAQCVYYRMLRNDHVREVSYAPTANVLTLAGNIAIDVLAHKAITKPALDALYAAIPKVPTYANPLAMYVYNGMAA